MLRNRVLQYLYGDVVIAWRVKFYIKQSLPKIFVLFNASLFNLISIKIRVHVGYLLHGPGVVYNCWITHLCGVWTLYFWSCAGKATLHRLRFFHRFNIFQIETYRLPRA